MPGGGLEPPRPYGQRILSPLRLPIPPPGLQVQERAGRKYDPLRKLKIEKVADGNSSIEADSESEFSLMAFESSTALATRGD